VVPQLCAWWVVTRTAAMQTGGRACSPANPLGQFEFSSSSDLCAQAEVAHAPATASAHGKGGMSAMAATSAVGSSPLAPTQRTWSQIIDFIVNAIFVEEIVRMFFS
jgi:hypothetical protein